MSITTYSGDSEYRLSAITAATEQSANGSHLKYHYQQDGRYFLTDPESGKRLNVSRLTAYAEYGDEIFGCDAHHEIPQLKIDAPRFLDAISREEHAEYHRQDPDPEDVDGFPLLRPEQ